MKLPDTEVLQYDEYLLIADTWKLEWERGVQVPVDPDAIPPLVVRSVFLLSRFLSLAGFDSFRCTLDFYYVFVHFLNVHAV